MKVIKLAAIILFALIFTTSVTCYLWCNFTPDGQRWQQQNSKNVKASRLIPY